MMSRRPFRFCPEELERRDAPAVLSYSAPSGNGPDQTTVVLNSTLNRILILDDGVEVVSRPLNSVTGIAVTGAAKENDTLVIDYSVGYFAKPITFNGGAIGTDELEIKGTGLTSAVYHPNGKTTGSGLVQVSSTSITFTGSESVAVTKMSSLTMTSPNAVDALIVSVPADGATRVSGTSGGVAFAALTYADVVQAAVNVGVNDGNTPLDSLDLGALPSPMTVDIGLTMTTVGFAGRQLVFNGTIVSVTGPSGNDKYIDNTITPLLKVVDLGGDNYFDYDPGSTIDTTTGGGNQTLDLGRTGDDFVITIGTGGSAGTDTFLFEPTGDGEIKFEGSVVTVFGGAGNDTYIDNSIAPLQTWNDPGGNNTFVVNPGSTIDITAGGGGTQTMDVSGSKDDFVIDIGTGGSTGTDTVLFEPTSDGNVLFEGNLTTVIGNNGNNTYIDNTTTPLLTIVSGTGNDVGNLQPGSKIVWVESEDGGNDTFLFHRANHRLINANLQKGLIEDESGNTVEVVDSKGMRRPHVENLLGTGFADVMEGTDGDNILIGGGGTDVMNGRGGNDTYVVRLGGSTTVIDSAGNDTLDYSAEQFGISVDLSRSNGSNQNSDGRGSTLALFGDVENCIGTSKNDSLSGGPSSNILAGLSGNDRLAGQSGNDVLIGGSGVDDLNGGADRDILVGGSGADRLTAGSGEDILIAGFTVFDPSEALPDVPYLGGVDLGAWTAIRSIWTDPGTAFVDRLSQIRTGTGPLTGTGYQLTASGGDKTVENDDGAADVLTGGQAADWFFVFLAPGPDVITDNDDQGTIN